MTRIKIIFCEDTVLTVEKKDGYVFFIEPRSLEVKYHYSSFYHKDFLCVAVRDADERLRPFYFDWSYLPYDKETQTFTLYSALYYSFFSDASQRKVFWFCSREPTEVVEENVDNFQLNDAEYYPEGLNSENSIRVNLGCDDNEYIDQRYVALLTR